MNKEIKTIVKKTAKVACVTCVALGGAALIASGAALKALTEGAKYLKNTVNKIIDEEPVSVKDVADTVAEEVPEAENVEEDITPAEAEV